MFTNLRALGFAALLPMTAGAADLVIAVPPIQSANDSSAIPFSFQAGSVRYQEVYDALAFSQIPAGGLISQIGFIGDQVRGGGVGTISNIQVALSTTPKAVDGLSTVFAQNIGQDQTTVLTAQGLVLSASPGATTWLRLDQPFLYNPNSGNLLLDVRSYFPGIDFIGGNYFEFKTAVASGDSVSAVAALDVNSPNAAVASSSGLVTEFLVTPVPERSTYALAGLGTLILLVGRYIQTKTKLRTEKEKWH